MRVLLASPFLPPFVDAQLEKRKTISEILATSGDMDWCAEFVRVRLNGVLIPKEWWPYFTVKPEADGLLELMVVPQKGSILPILASVALVALTAGIGAFGAPFLVGAGWSASAAAFGASAAAAAVGIAGQIAISMLTAPPPTPKGPGAARDLSQAGIQANQVTLLETLPVVFGKMLVSPPLISPAYTTFDAEEITVHAIVGLQGRCLIENILVNGTDITLIEGVEYETREGGPADAALTLAQLTCIQQTEQVVLPNMKAKLENGRNDQLDDQVTPAESLSKRMPFKTDGTPDEIWIRLLFPSGIVKSDDNSTASAPIRIRLRKSGDVAWRNLPTFHIWDVRKGSGPMRTEIKLKFQTTPGGRLISRTEEYPIWEITNITGYGETFEYESDSYFQGTFPTNYFLNDGVIQIIPVMTAATTSGVTMSASSTNGTDDAWKASDSNPSTTYWRPANNSLPAWIKVDFGSAKTIKSWGVTGDNAISVTPTTMPTLFYLEGSNDNINWTRLDGENHGMTDDFIHPRYFAQVGSPGSYRYYRLNVLANNGAANQQLQMGDLRMFTQDCPGVCGNITTDSGNTYGVPLRHFNSSTESRSRHAKLTRNGAEVYLDPAQWLPGAYEVDVRRGVAFDVGSLDPEDYAYGASELNADFFDYRLSGGFYVIRVGQKNYRSDCIMEVFSSVSNDVPVDTSGIACIAVKIKNTNINSLSAEFTSYAPIYSGGVWTDTEVPTTKPAALYRKLLLGHANPDPTPGEIIDEDALVTWYNRCVTKGYEVNAITQGRSVDEVKRLIAYCGYATPRDTNIVSIAEDYNRTAESISQMLSPLNAKNLGCNLALPRLPDAIYAEYLDAADDWKVRRDIIYRTGFNVNTASFFDTITYDGFTSTAKVATRAAFDLLQMQLRAASYPYEIGIEGYSIKRGDLLGLIDDTLDIKQAYGLIRSIETSGANVVSITLDNIIPFSGGSGDIAAVGDIATLTDILDTTQPMGVAIRLETGLALIKTVSTVTDTNICTFTTPFASAGSGLAVGQLVAAGISGREFRRVIVTAVEPTGLETRTITVRDEAPELFA